MVGVSVVSVIAGGGDFLFSSIFRYKVSHFSLASPLEAAVESCVGEDGSGIRAGCALSLSKSYK